MMQAVYGGGSSASRARALASSGAPILRLVSWCNLQSAGLPANAVSPGLRRSLRNLPPDNPSSIDGGQVSGLEGCQGFLEGKGPT